MAWVDVFQHPVTMVLHSTQLYTTLFQLLKHNMRIGGWWENQRERATRKTKTWMGGPRGRGVEG
jgi:hypothetical protein